MQGLMASRIQLVLKRGFSASTSFPQNIQFTRSHAKVVLQPGSVSVDGTLGPVESVVADSVLRMRVGPSAHASQSIGDVTGIEIAKTNGWNSPDAPLVNIEWEGYGQSEGDELYHTVWHNISGITPLSLPFPARVRKVNPTAKSNPDRLDFEMDECSNRGWIVEVEAKAADALPHLLDVNRYLDILHAAEEKIQSIGTISFDEAQERLSPAPKLQMQSKEWCSSVSEQGRQQQNII
jgi:glycine cleavage system H lipoate-binding protein